MTSYFSWISAKNIHFTSICYPFFQDNKSAQMMLKRLESQAINVRFAIRVCELNQISDRFRVG